MSIWGTQKFGWKTLPNSIIHIVVGAVGLLPYLVWPDSMGAFMSGCLWALYREVDQYRRLERDNFQGLNLLDRLLDIVTTGIGCELIVWFWKNFGELILQWL